VIKNGAPGVWPKLLLPATNHLVGLMNTFFLDLSTSLFLGWQIDNPNYQVTNDNKIASKVTSDPSILYSSGAQFGPGHSIEFTVREMYN
jgi:hypothetical protein